MNNEKENKIVDFGVKVYEKRSGQNSQNIFLKDIIRDWNESITSQNTPEH